MNPQVEGSDDSDDDDNATDAKDADEDDETNESLENVVDNDEGEEMHLRKMAEERGNKDSADDDTEADQETGSSSASREFP